MARKQLRLDEQSLLGAGQRLLLIADLEIELRELVIRGNAEWIELDKILNDFDRGLDLASFNQATRKLLTDLRVRWP